MVIIPRIEYRTQLTFLSERECSDIIIPFRKLYKHKLHFSSSLPNATLENYSIYRFRDLYEVQLQSKITNFYLQINDPGVLGWVMKIRICQLQLQEWLRFSPLREWPYNLSKRFYTKFLAVHLALCKQHNFSTFSSPHLHNSVLGGTVE